MIGFFVALEHFNKDDFIKDVESYLEDDARYIVAMEIAKDKHIETKGEHFHFVGDMTDKQYDTFRKTILVKKYKRQGVARNGVGRQYGKIGKVRDETKLMQYTCKDNNIIYRKIDLKTIQELIHKSYQKEDRQFPFKELLGYLKANSQSYYEDMTKYPDWDDHRVEYDKIEFDIIQFYLDNSTCEKVLTRPQIKSIVTKYLMYYTPYQNKHDIYNYIMR
ncbi:MAG: putative replicase [Cressdnaviricota sp.]|nr:MAG: putative replicase [Cressdnaviricota sp.]